MYLTVNKHTMQYKSTTRHWKKSELYPIDSLIMNWFTNSHVLPKIYRHDFCRTKHEAYAENLAFQQKITSVE